MTISRGARRARSHEPSDDVNSGRTFGIRSEASTPHSSAGVVRDTVAADPRPIFGDVSLRMVAAVICSFNLAVGCAPPPRSAERSQTPEISATPTAVPSQTPILTTESPTASPPPKVEPLLGVHVSAVQALPAEYRYVWNNGPDTDQILLADLIAGTTAVVASISHESRPGYSAVIADATGVSADGRTVVAMRHGSDLKGGDIFAIRPLTGDVSLIYASKFDYLAGPVISADGRRVAFQRAGASSASGIWVASLADGTLTRALTGEDASIGPLALSPDGVWLAATAGMPGPLAAVVLVDTRGPEVRVNGKTGQIVSGKAALVTGVFKADLSRGADAALLWDTIPESPSQVLRYDATTSRSRTLYRPGGEIGIRQATPNPVTDEYLTVEYTFGPANRGSAVWRRSPTATAVRLSDPDRIGDVWWSRDGSAVYAVFFRSDTKYTEIVNIIGFQTVASFCRPVVPCF